MSTPNLTGKYGRYKTLKKPCVRKIITYTWYNIWQRIRNPLRVSCPYSWYQVGVCLEKVRMHSARIECKILRSTWMQCPRTLWIWRQFLYHIWKATSLASKNQYLVRFFNLIGVWFYFIGSSIEFYSCLNLHCTITDCSLYWVGLSFKHENDFCFPTLNFTACGVFHDDKTLCFDAWSPLPERHPRIPERNTETTWTASIAS